MEGKFRPGHFSGVALVVSKLFNIVQANKVYFGQKDYQQLQIINRLTAELKFNAEIRTVPIVREPTGLALSSRNQRLSNDERKMATLLFESLSYAKEQLLKGLSFGEIKNEIETRFNNNKKLKLEYFELAHKQTLLPINNTDQRDAILLIAAFVNDVRLIDNMLLKD
jgi:pantoate--beta-alanine ligase